MFSVSAVCPVEQHHFSSMFKMGGNILVEVSANPHGIGKFCIVLQCQLYNQIDSKSHHYIGQAVKNKTFEHLLYNSCVNSLKSPYLSRRLTQNINYINL